MIKKLLIVLFCLFLAHSIQAQHCPFDGSSIIIVKINGKKEDILHLKLQEVNNPKADSCTYAEGLLKMSFQPMDSLYARNDWVETYEKRYKMQSIKSKGDLYVKLNQATADCMIKNGNNYTYVKRQYVINYKNRKTGQLHQITVPENGVFKMCTTAGSWNRFVAINIGE